MAGLLLLLSFLTFSVNARGKALLDMHSVDLIENKNTSYTVELVDKLYNRTDQERSEVIKDNMKIGMVTITSQGSHDILPLEVHAETSEIRNESTTVRQITEVKEMEENIATEKVTVISSKGETKSPQNNNIYEKSTPAILQDNISHNAKTGVTTQENNNGEEVKPIVAQVISGVMESVTIVSQENSSSEKALQALQRSNTSDHETTLLKEQNVGIEVTKQVSHYNNTREKVISTILNRNTSGEEMSTSVMKVKNSETDETKKVLEMNYRSEDVTPTISQGNTMNKIVISTFSPKSNTSSDHVSTTGSHTRNLSAEDHVLQKYNFSKEVTNTIIQKSYQGKDVTSTHFQDEDLATVLTEISPDNFITEGNSITVQHRNEKTIEGVLQSTNLDSELTKNITQHIMSHNENTLVPQTNSPNQKVTTDLKKVDFRVTQEINPMTVTDTMKINSGELTKSTLSEFKALGKEVTAAVQENSAINVSDRSFVQNTTNILSIKTMVTENVADKENGMNNEMITTKTNIVKEIVATLTKEETTTNKDITQTNEIPSTEGELTITGNNEEIAKVSEQGDSRVLETADISSTAAGDESNDIEGINSTKTATELFKEKSGLVNYKRKRDASLDIIKQSIKKHPRHYWLWWKKLLHCKT